MTIEDIILGAAKLNRTFQKIKGHGIIGFENMKIVNNFHADYSELEVIESAIINSINNTQFVLLLSRLNKEIEVNLTYYDK